MILDFNWAIITMIAYTQTSCEFAYIIIDPLQLEVVQNVDVQWVFVPSRRKWVWLGNHERLFVFGRKEHTVDIFAYSHMLPASVNFAYLVFL